MSEPSLPSAPHIQDLIADRMSRRGVLASLSALPLLTLAGEADAKPRAATVGLTFDSVPSTIADTVTVPPGYTVKTLIAWGDALFDSVSPKVDLDGLTRAEQEQRFGQNNDMLAMFPLRWAYPTPTSGRRYLLCVNHEYVEPSLMLPAMQDRAFSADQLQGVIAAMGVSVVQIERGRDGWRVVKDAKPGAGLNRRITPFTPVVFSGPAAKHPWIEKAGAAVNAAEPGARPGEIACGTHSNCAGGSTPWGTYLSAEENFNGYFHNSDPATTAAIAADPAVAADARTMAYPVAAKVDRPGMPRQMDLAHNPYGPALYGWTVEVDPYDPTWAPRKRTALGRRKGECANSALARDGRVAVYSGDDQANEFVYKFVSTGRFDPSNRIANRDLLDNGVLYVARFDVDGTGAWVELSLAAANAAAAAAGLPPFADLGDVMVRARLAARLLGATPMDRPEDVEAIVDARWVGQGPVLIACTNNRDAKAATPANPRRAGEGVAESNLTGHVVRIDEDGADAAATRFRWDVFAMAGDPDAAVLKTDSGRDIPVDVASTFTGARFACPDNVCFDTRGHVWISTDGSDGVFDDCNDMVVATPVTATGARPVKRFLVGPMGAEICGPMLSPDQRTFFAAIQHPGENDADGTHISRLRWTEKKRPPSSFPDGGDAWPRSAVVTVMRSDGKKIGA